MPIPGNGAQHYSLKWICSIRGCPHYAPSPSCPLRMTPSPFLYKWQIQKVVWLNNCSFAKFTCRSYSIVLRGEGYFPAKNVICLDQYRLSARGNRSLVSTRRVQFNLKPVADPGLSGRGKGGGGTRYESENSVTNTKQTTNNKQSSAHATYFFPPLRNWLGDKCTLPRSLPPDPPLLTFYTVLMTAGIARSVTVLRRNLISWI